MKTTLHPGKAAGLAKAKAVLKKRLDDVADAECELIREYIRLRPIHGASKAARMLGSNDNALLFIAKRRGIQIPRLPAGGGRKPA